MLIVDGLNVYRGELHVVQDVNFIVNEGEIVAILGPNGAGKTTLLESIVGLISPSRGSILFKNQNITHLPPHVRAALGIGCSFGREYLFFEMTVEENIELGIYCEKNKIDKKKNLDWVYNLFPSLRELRKNKVKYLSGGEQQMVSLARALIRKPSFLIIDEASSGLSPKITLTVFKTIEQINKEGITVLLVEQNVKQALKIADVIYIMESGRIVGKFKKSSNEIEKIPKYYFGL
jgi:branched-chain amino acid transport system ATP-binding protein